jgi:hypothetical protein
MAIRRWVVVDYLKTGGSDQACALLTAKFAALRLWVESDRLG